MRRRPDEVRQPLTKRDEPFVNPRWWTMSEDERRMMAERTRFRRERPTWPFALAAVVLALLTIAVESFPALPEVPCVKQINELLAPAVDPGDRNGLLHK